MNGDNGSNNTDRRLIVALASHVHNANYIKCTLDSLKNNGDKESLIKFLNSHEGLKVSEIECEVIKITGKFQEGTENGKG